MQGVMYVKNITKMIIRTAVALVALQGASIYAHASVVPLASGDDAIKREQLHEAFEQAQVFVHAARKSGLSDKQIVAKFVDTFSEKLYTGSENSSEFKHNKRYVWILVGVVAALGIAGASYWMYSLMKQKKENDNSPQNTGDTGAVAPVSDDGGGHLENDETLVIGMVPASVDGVDLRAGYTPIPGSDNGAAGPMNGDNGTRQVMGTPGPDVVEKLQQENDHLREIIDENKQTRREEELFVDGLKQEVRAYLAGDDAMPGDCLDGDSASCEVAHRPINRVASAPDFPAAMTKDIASGFGEHTDSTQNALDIPADAASHTSFRWVNRNNGDAERAGVPSEKEPTGDEEEDDDVYSDPSPGDEKTHKGVGSIALGGDNPAPPAASENIVQPAAAASTKLETHEQPNPEVKPEGQGLLLGLLDGAEKLNQQLMNMEDAEAKEQIEAVKNDGSIGAWLWSLVPSWPGKKTAETVVEKKSVAGSSEAPSVNGSSNENDEKASSAPEGKQNPGQQKIGKKKKHPFRKRGWS